ncbi:hypothetical protein J6590_017077 [Homalodisca vitripennis]|nr:hypothetical protein J6590_017077 [Homalodisca vitripennis]
MGEECRQNVLMRYEVLQLTPYKGIVYGTESAVRCINRLAQAETIILPCSLCRPWPANRLKCVHVKNVCPVTTQDPIYEISFSRCDNFDT